MQPRALQTGTVHMPKLFHIPLLNPTPLKLAGGFGVVDAKPTPSVPNSSVSPRPLEARPSVGFTGVKAQDRKQPQAGSVLLTPRPSMGKKLDKYVKNAKPVHCA